MENKKKALEKTGVLQYTLKSVSELTANPRNARTHSKSQIKKIANSIKEFGFISPAIIDKKGILIAGHGRLEAAKTLGMEEIPCIIADHLTPAQLRAYMLADNRIQLDAGWDEDILKVELGELSEIGFNIDLTGFDVSEVSGHLRQNFEAGTEDDQGKLDELKPKMVKCPHCEKDFDSRGREQ
jgi:ParB-like chromosome segregation protein Spo0J